LRGGRAGIGQPAAFALVVTRFGRIENERRRRCCQPGSNYGASAGRQLVLDKSQLALDRQLLVPRTPAATVPVRGIPEVALHAVRHRVDPVREPLVLVVLRDHMRALPIPGEGEIHGFAERRLKASSIRGTPMIDVTPSAGSSPI
jgi:hypothetical protein